MQIGKFENFWLIMKRRGRRTRVDIGLPDHYTTPFQKCPVSGKILARFWQDSGKILARFWQDSGKILARFWQDSGKILARFWQDSGKILARFWQDSGKTLARPWQDSVKIRAKCAQCTKEPHKYTHYFGSGQNGTIENVRTELGKSDTCRMMPNRTPTLKLTLRSFILMPMYNLLEKRAGL
jgi:hypothetical protein